MQDSAAIPPFVIPQQRRTATQTPASSFIHDLPVQEKKKSAFQNNQFFFFLKLGMRSNSIRSHACIQAVANVGKLLSGDKSTPINGNRGAGGGNAKRPWRPLLVS